MVDDFEHAKRTAHRDNIERYRRLLRTSLTDNERQFVKRRLDEEEAALREIAVNSPAVALAGS